jgi:small subunit ribosomal protein S4e
MQRLVKIDGKVRTDATYPAGFMDVLEIAKTDEFFRIIYDAKGRFVVHRIQREEAAYKLCKVKKLEFGKGGVPYIVTHDGRTIRYPDPDIKVLIGRRGGCKRGMVLGWYYLFSFSLN